MQNTSIETILNSGGIIAISRGNYGSPLLNAVEAILSVGVRAVEVTFEQNADWRETGRSISALVDRFGTEMTIGAGTVLTLDQLRLACDSGAKYIVSPNTDAKIIAETKSLGLGSIPGAMTPSEIVAAHSFGADVVKVFPAGALGAAYFAAVTTPLAHIRCAAVGGVTVANLPAFKKAGACAFGISSSILNNKLIAEGRFGELRSNAAAFAAAARAKPD